MSDDNNSIQNKMMANDEAIYLEENKLFSLFSKRKRKNVRDQVLKDLYEEKKQLQLEYESINNRGAGELNIGEIET
jgi:hypothetical protein